MGDKLYDKDYAKTWIDSYESGDDEFRVKYLQPYMKDRLSSVTDGMVLDVGCGWGQALDYLGDRVQYYGTDIVPEFFDYIRDKHPESENIHLSHGGLPDGISAQDDTFDLAICSMVLHTIPDLDRSIKILCSKVKASGKAMIITFNDSSRDYLESCFKRIDESTDDSLRGILVLPSKIAVKCEIYFHGEASYEQCLSKYGTYSKTILGPVFVAYEFTRTV